MNCKTLITGSNPVVASKANLQDLCGFTSPVKPLFFVMCGSNNWLKQQPRQQLAEKRGEVHGQERCHESAEAGALEVVNTVWRAHAGKARVQGL
jgi:hypothetical protein